MRFVVHKPRHPLSHVVDYLWWLSDAPGHAQERIVPTGTQELVINLHSDAFEIRSAESAFEPRRFGGAMVSGAYGRYFVVDTSAHASLLGVHFKPGCAGAILGLPPGELADTHVELELLWGSSARALRERLLALADGQARFRALEAELERRLAVSRAPNPAVALALEHLAREREPVGAVAAELGLSPRRFIELFTAEVGMTPKLYARVQRFQRALKSAPRGRLSWAEVAQRAGYCDQSHLIRDFSCFSGFSPTALLRRRAPELKHHHFEHPG